MNDRFIVDVGEHKFEAHSLGGRRKPSEPKALEPPVYRPHVTESGTMPRRLHVERLRRQYISRSLSKAVISVSGVEAEEPTAALEEQAFKESGPMPPSPRKTAIDVTTIQRYLKPTIQPHGEFADMFPLSLFDEEGGDDRTVAEWEEVFSIGKMIVTGRAFLETPGNESPSWHHVQVVGIDR